MVDVYTRYAQRFFDQYQQLTFEDVHRQWLSHLPYQPGFALDVGAGSGRDAAALARRGWEVLAVEPAQGLRKLGEEATRGASVEWLDDRLPELSGIRKLSYRFNLILVSAVWMHLPPTQRARAFRILSELLAPGGTLVITLRHGPDDGERTFYETDRQELEAWARDRALINLPASPDSDKLQRPDVWWETLVFRLVDDGTGALPILRNIVVNDDKSSTYKLGLLRTITRIADSVPGMVIRRTDEWVDLPLGVVALYWISLYQPLILRHNLRQAPGSKGYGFAKDDFRSLANVSPMDLRIGQGLSSELGGTVQRAIRDAARTITSMPARYTTWPGTDNPVFESSTARILIKPGAIRLDRELLSRFGTFRVPALLWDCFSRYACWLEPAIVNEWAQLMRGYSASYSSDILQTALSWEEGRRDTSRVRAIVTRRLAQKDAVNCVWTRQSLAGRRYDIDHCFPWSRWSNNDLWNLMPATHQANAAKSEKLPAAPLLRGSRTAILEWWDGAFMSQEREQQFFAEAEAALPIASESNSLEAVFDGVMQQRLRLKMNQQLVEWVGI